MIISCRAQSQFTFEHWTGDGRLRRKYLVEIMSALEKQHDTLRVLKLEPNDFEPNNMGLEHLTYTRLDGFHKLCALEKLSVPFRTLMGRPPRTSTTEEELYYPQMQHVLPPQLEELDLYIKPSEICPAHSDRYPSTFISVLPSNYEHLNLQKVHLTYRKREPCEFAMLINIWEIKQTFLEHGVQFEYSVTFATSDPNYEPESDELTCVSQGLARFGPKGVEMAHHFGQWRHEMVARVLMHLDYTADWMDSEEGRRCMFGAVSEPLKRDAQYWKCLVLE